MFWRSIINNMNKNVNRLLRILSIFIFICAIVCSSCQNKIRNTQNQHVENILSIEKAYYWNDIIQAGINSHQYEVAIPYLDSLIQYCNYFEEASYIFSWIYLRSSKELYDENKGLKYLLQAAYGIPNCESRINVRSARGYSGLPYAKFDLALNYLYGGYGIDKDEAKGIQLLDTLSKANFAGGKGSIMYEWVGEYVGPKAKIMLAKFYNEGSKGLTQDKRKAAQLWDEALEMAGRYYMDSPDLLEIIGKEYLNTNNPYYKDITVWLLNDAKPEEPATQILLALCYRLGKGVPKDIRKSKNIIQRVSIDKDLGEALYPLMDYISGK